MWSHPPSRRNLRNGGQHSPTNPLHHRTGLATLKAMSLSEQDHTNCCTTLRAVYDVGTFAIAEQQIPQFLCEAAKTFDPSTNPGHIADMILFLDAEITA